MTDNERTLYTCLKKFWATSRERKYKFYREDGKEWLSTSIDNMLKYTKLNKEDLLNAFEGLKADDRIDYKSRVYENRDFVTFSNNW